LVILKCLKKECDERDLIDRATEENIYLDLSLGSHRSSGAAPKMKTV